MALTRIEMIWMVKLSYVKQATKCAREMDMYMMPDSAILCATRRNCLAVADNSDLTDAWYIRLTNRAGFSFSVTFHTDGVDDLLVQYIFKTLVDPQKGISTIPGPMIMLTDAQMYGPR